METLTHHAISYVELTVADLAQAQLFYGRAFGWRFTDYGPSYAGIRATVGEGEVGGLSMGTPTDGGGPLVLLYSEDVDASAEAVRAAGGTVLEGPYDFPGGRRFVFADPSGNRLGVFSAG